MLKWGKNPDIEESAVLLQPDITFFDILQNPILLIQFVEKYKITEEKRLKVRELGIDVVQIIIPRDSPENIAKSLEVTQHTRWMYNHTEQNTDYAQLQHRNRERISISDAVEMGFFKETFACRESQINNFIRKVARYLRSQHYRESEQHLRDGLSGVESDTIRDRQNWSIYEARLEKELKQDIQMKLSQLKKAKVSSDSALEQLKEKLEQKKLSWNEDILIREKELSVEEEKLKNLSGTMTTLSSLQQQSEQSKALLKTKSRQLNQESMKLSEAESQLQNDLNSLKSRNNQDLKEKEKELEQQQSRSLSSLSSEEEQFQQLLKQTEKEQLKQLRIEIAAELPNCPAELRGYLISGELSLIGMKYRGFTTETEKLMTALRTGLTKAGLNVDEYFLKMDENIR